MTYNPPPTQADDAGAEADDDLAPLMVSTSQLLRRPGSQRTVAVALRFAESSTSVGATAAVGLDGSVVIESRAGGLNVDGTVDLTWKGICRRCLDEVIGHEELPIHELYERQPVEGETYQLPDEDLDIAPMLREATLLALPLVPLCSDDCAGPAPTDFPMGVEGQHTPGQEEGEDDEEPTPSGDPRWAALDALVFEDPDPDTD